MSERSWHMDDISPEVSAPTAGQHVLVNLHFILAALRRRWLVWVAAGCTGLMLGLTYAALVPAMTVGTVTLMLVHPPGSNADADSLARRPHRRPYGKGQRPLAPHR